MIRESSGDALRAPADAAAGVEDQRRLRVPASAGGQRGGEGCPVEVEDGFPERLREMATEQRLDIAVRAGLCAGNEARVACHHAASGTVSRMPAATSRRSMSAAAATGRRRW